ncbi:MAG TPA: hypothetical protein VIP46_06615 [Pyrinomonadaceae bacterium]
MATIREKIIEQRDKILSNDADVASEAISRLRTQAVAAMYGGPGSEAWVTFMRNFADNDAQLARLTERRVEDHLCNRYIDLARTYLIGNAVCTPNTTLHFLDGIDDILDQTLSG